MRSGFLGVFGIAEQGLAEFESRFVNLERSNPGLEGRARNPEPSGCPRGSGNPASGLGQCCLDDLSLAARFSIILER
jgi:hypothetical protein